MNRVCWVAGRVLPSAGRAAGRVWGLQAADGQILNSTLPPIWWLLWLPGRIPHGPALGSGPATLPGPDPLVTLQTGLLCSADQEGPPHSCYAPPSSPAEPAASASPSESALPDQEPKSTGSGMRSTRFWSRLGSTGHSPVPL